MSQGEHFSVLLAESVEALVTNPDGTYVDGTFGRGGHSRAILERLSDKGRLVAFDKDPQAIATATELAERDGRFAICHQSFADLSKGLISQGVGEKVDGVLLDLGVSSPQLDQAERGFSFLRDGPLDMRMNNQSGESAAEWLARVNEEDLVFVLKEYGEERYAKRLARAVVETREQAPLTRTVQLAELLKAAHPNWEKGKHPATKAFQAIRIFINAELDDLDRALHAGLDQIKQNGRFVVISFHSLEDRMVKRFFRDQTKGKAFPPGVPVTEDMLERKMKLVGKAQKAGKQELDQNIRSRSAVMRVAEKI